nr:MAG TPA: hypothetical protein [Caudoviricetes sp.]
MERIITFRRINVRKDIMYNYSHRSRNMALFSISIK